MQFGTVTGRLLATIADRVNDPDTDPDVVPVTGTVRFTPSVASVISSTEDAIIMPTPIEADIDSDGYISLNGVRGVTLVATDSSDLNPSGFTYTVSFVNLKFDKFALTYKPFSISLPAGTTVDLATVTPVGSSNGALLVRGPKGDPGTDLTAPLQTYSTFTASKWFGALQRVRLGQGNAKLLCVGDSTTAGVGGTQADSWPALVKNRLNLSIPTQSGLSLAMVLNIDSARWSLGGWMQAFGPGGNGLYANPGSGADAVFTPGVVVDTIDVWYYRAAGKGSFVVKIDGVAQPAIDTQGPEGAWLKTTYTVSPAANHTVAFQMPASGDVGPVSVAGIDAYLSTTKSVRVANWGVSGSVTDTWANGIYSKDAIRDYQPDLTIIMLGINDAGQGLPVATWSANMLSLIQTAQLSGDVILMSVVPSDSTGLVAWEAQYRDAAKALAASTGSGFLDLFAEIGAYSPDTYADALHPNPRGYADIARFVMRGLSNL